MSYQVIARKWRPQTFADLVGQPHISQTLLNALQFDRLPHALLFTGPRGTGKTSTARILAKALRCPHAVNFIPCHECGECKDIAAGSSLSVIEIDGASNNGVEDVRELRNSVNLMPSSGKYKIYIIDEVHMLSSSAFNALLKTLEEPPPHVLFIMATTEVQKIPNTILSRCQRFDFRRIPVRMVAESLMAICQAEGIEAEKEALWVVARQGEGSMRDSQSLLDQVITYCQGPVTLAGVTEALGLTDRQMLLDTLKALVERDQAKTIDIVERLFFSGYDSRIYVQDLLEELRHLLLVKITPAERLLQLVDLPDSEIEYLKEMSATLSEEDIHLLFDMALKGANDIPRSQDPKIMLEMLLLRMASAPRMEALQSWVQQGAQPPSSKPLPVVSTSPQAPPNPGPNDWRDLVQQIQGVNSIVGASLEHTCLLKTEGQVLHLGVTDKKKFLIDQLSSSDFQKKVNTYLKTFWGPGFSFVVEALGPCAQTAAQHSSLTPRALEEKIKEEKKQELLRQVQEHPLIKTTQSLFKTEIRAIKEIKL